LHITQQKLCFVTQINKQLSLYMSMSQRRFKPLSSLDLKYGPGHDLY